MSDDLLRFADEFSHASHDEWLALVEKTLKGKPFDKAMQTKTYNGFDIDAFASELPLKLQHQPTRPAGDWNILSPNWTNDAKIVNADILEDLERGASGIALTISSNDTLGMKGYDLPVALEGVYLDMVPFMLIQTGVFEDSTKALKKLLDERTYDHHQITGNLGIDPLSVMARGGISSSTFEGSIDKAVATSIEWSKTYPNVATFMADGTVYSNAGASEALELAACLSSALYYMKSLETAGMSLKQAASQIQFTLSTGTDLWLNIAKFRALRRCWQQILIACGVENNTVKINAVSALSQFTIKDPWVNILRGTAACFAAGIGGADSVMVLPHDIMLGSTDKFSRRIARNIQIVLAEESNLAKVVDPSAGSYSIEALTTEMTEAALAAFQKMEKEGGVVAEVKKGKLANQINETLTSKQKDVRKRKQAITGVSEFPNIDEEVLSDILKNDIREPGTHLTLRRIAAEFENLRFKSDEMLRKSGGRPSIFLANLGAPADFTARATFAKNFFEAGGIKGVFGAGKADTNDLAREYSASGAPVAVICGSDAQYNDFGVEVVTKLKSAGCKRIYIAGKLSEPEAFNAAGLDEMIYMGCDVITAVENAYVVIAEKLAAGDGS